MKLESWVAQIEASLRAAASRSRSSHDGAYAGTDLEFLGVQTAEWRTLVHRLDGELPASWEECARALWKSPVFEARAMALELAARHQREFAKPHWSLFSGWLKESVGWAMIDGLCDAVIAPMLVRYPELVQKTRAWVRSRNVWLRRASLVVFCRTVRNQLYSDEAFEHAAALLADRNPMITKAVSWILRALIKHYPKRVQSFLRQHESEIAPAALREVRLKLTTGTKSGRQRKGEK
ncbi:DNA alkylation repair protein [bacterium]|nr:DNA alkylation repair protein [bacterium]MBU1984682.1 DNA alkylation repair protein [bacterium]